MELQGKMILIAWACKSLRNYELHLKTLISGTAKGPRQELKVTWSAIPLSSLLNLLGCPFPYSTKQEFYPRSLSCDLLDMEPT